MKRSIISAAIAAAAISAPAMAEEYPYYATFGVSHTDTEITERYFKESDYTKNSYNLEASFGIMMTEQSAVELSFIKSAPAQSTKRPDFTDFKLNGFYFFGDAALKPYLTAGIGHEKLELNDDADTEYSDYILGAGFGVQYDLTDRFFGRAEARLDDMIDKRPEHPYYVLEVGMRLGTPKAAPVVATPEPMPKPEPEPEPVVVIVPPADTDNDGVIDDMDKCAATPAGVTVDSDGCPDFQGKLEGVTFETNSARLTINSQTILDEAATELKLYPDLDIEIAAYTDSMGADSYNQMLSQKRAESVLSYLVSKGVSPEQLTAVGYGEANPVASNETSAGRAQNRRVELVVKK
ncbi:MAG TPA: hypothetical protein DEA26_10830 [Oceanospirillales bacterium]|nr:hypothetical protein [Oceanospirillaceae bacterium]HBS43167.1 hypothetical protein [Oceanospirillales bacterium]|tara:strand:- start:52974 stop:54023 length:1050 start_codon:yes stop_codon:yes gene_type:complete